MISRETARKITREALEHSSADETMVILSGGKKSLTRFANDEIHQNVMQKDYSIKVIAACGAKVGTASGNWFEEHELKKVVERAVETAGLQREDPNWLPMLGRMEYEESPLAYDEKTISLFPEEKAEMLRKVVSICEADGVSAAGALTNGDNMVCVASSTGLFCYQSWTYASFTMTATTPDDAAGWSEWYGNRILDLDIEKETERAVRKALAARNPVELESGRWRVLLEPSAFSSFVNFMAWLGFGGLAFVEGRSFMSGKLGEKLLGDNVTIVDDFSHEATKGLPFDFEGHPRRRVTIIERGVAVSPVHDRRTAAKAGAESTGHALPYPSAYGPMPLNLRFEPGSTPADSMLEKLDRGLLVTRTFYENVVDPKRPSITGMTRDGTYIVEDGRIVKAVKNLRFNVDIRQLMNSIVEIGDDLTSIDETAVPSVIAEGFNVTGSTR